MRLAPDEFVMREWFDLAGFDQDHVVRVLHFAFDEQRFEIRSFWPQLDGTSYRSPVTLLREGGREVGLAGPVRV